MAEHTYTDNNNFSNNRTAIDVLKHYFGYSTFRAGQEILVNNILNGQDVLGIMPTGAGKSICYQVPALMLSGITLVISPLISLMKDQVKSLNDAGIHAAFINSSLTENQISKALKLAGEGKYKIIYVAPERLLSNEFLWFTRQVEISMVTVDEAHCISQWGQDFRPSYLKIVKFVEELPVRPIVSAFTATATEEVKNDIVCTLGLNNPNVLVTGFDRENLYFGVETVKGKDDYVLQYVREHAGESGIIYCATRKNVDKVYEKLIKDGAPVTCYHAGLSDAVRRENQDDFIYDRKSVIVATNAFGMGIDKSNVRYVLHYNMPQSMENYYQEAGRAGRDGEPSECVVLYSAQDVMIDRYLIDNKEFEPDMPFEDREAVRLRDSARLRKMTDYCMTTECLRGYILRYFGDANISGCGNCSSCMAEYDSVDRTEEAIQVLSCVKEAKGRYGVNVIAGTLAGSGRGKIKEYGCNEYRTYGALNKLSEVEIKQIINWLVMKDYLRQTEDKYGLIRLGSRAKELLDIVNVSGRVGENIDSINESADVNGRDGIEPEQIEPKRIEQERIKPERVLMKISKKQMEKAIGNERKKKATASVDLNSRGFDLFDELRSLRMELAKKENVPPYIVFNDKTLVNMCVLVPLTREEMLKVSGVGENKYAKYGEQFIECISAFTGGMKEKLYYGDDILSNEQNETKNGRGNIIGAARITKRNKDKLEFAITNEQAVQFTYADRYRAPEIAEILYSMVDTDIFKKVSGADIYRYVEGEGLAGERFENGKRRKYVTDEGREKGLFLDTRISKKGTEYLDLFYDRDAQRMIVEHFVKGE